MMSIETSMGSGWFAVAVQALVVLARTEGNCSSSMIACSLKAHAVFLRRVMAQLVRSDIVEVREGRDGGYRLSRAAECITLADVYKAVHGVGALDLSPYEAHSDCTFTCRISAVMHAISNEVDEQVQITLTQHTIAQIVAKAL
ncbi:RrF2 family transcriptional regulator [Dictyobacter arantiisoli]|nr:Rrf2 family transcriptional regulator [Dictyobacter arantiisoli]